MIEQIILDHFDTYNSTSAYMQVPEQIPSKYVLIEKTGSSLINHIKSATIAVQSYADSLLEACELNEWVKSVMLSGLIQLDEIVSVKLQTDYNFSDTTKKKYRYQAVFDVVHY